MRILALDVGEKRIGVAVSDPLGITARGLEVITRKSIKEDTERIGEIAQELEVEKIIVGTPLNMNGTKGFMVERVQSFARKLHGRLGISVEDWDERLSTATAEKTLIDADMSRKKRKKVIDKVAAIVILQNYLDAKNNLKGGF